MASGDARHDEILAARLSAGPLPFRETVALGLSVATALEAAHAMGLAHGPFGPEDLVLLGGDVDRVELLPGNEHPGRSRATMAPEHARAGTTVDADPRQGRRADVFSLGAVLYHCLTGAPLFAADDPVALLAKIVFEDIPRVGARVSGLPEALETLLARMLERDPARRPPDAGAVAAELRAVPVDDEAPPSRAPSTRPELGTGERRVVIVVLVSGGAGAPGTASPLPEPLSVLRAAVEARHGVLAALSDGALAAVLPGAGLAEDRVAVAAECAVALRTLLPRRPMALALGRTGDAIDRAARLLRAMARVPSPSPAAGIAVDEIAAALLERRFDLGEGPAGRELRGGRPPIESPRTLLGQPTPCVGREREIDALAAVFERCSSEPHARAALVTAPAGFGKSRLAHELLERLYGHAEIWIGRGDPSSAGSAFSVLAAALKHTAGLFDGDPLPLRREKLRARVARNLPSASGARVAAFLGELLGTPFPEDTSPDLAAAREDAVLMGDQVRRAWVDFVRAETAWSNLVLVLDDLHWGDLPSLQLVDAALAALPARPLMVLGLGRPEVHDRFPGLWAEHDVAELRLGGLAPEACARLVSGVLGDTVAPATAAWLVEQSDGHPLYLEELIRAAARGAADDGAERGVDTVRAMVEMRLARLDPEARRVLRIASIFGETFWLGGVTALFGDPAELARRLAELAGEELVIRHQAARFAGEEELAFRHALVREAAYATLTDEDQKLGHRLAGEWLERAGETDAMVLAAHFEAGRDFGRAAGWYRRATEQAFGGSDLDAVIDRAARGVACLGRAFPEDTRGGAAAGPPPSRGSSVGALSLYQAEAHRWRGELPAAERHAGDAMSRLRPGSALWFVAARERILATSGDRLLGVVLRVRAAPPDESVAPAQLGALAAAHARLLAEGLREGAAEILPVIEDLAGARAAADAASAALLHDARAQHAFHTGDAAGFLRHAELAYAAFERAGDLRNAVARRVDIGRAWGLLGVHEEAEHALRAALPEAARMGLAALAALARHRLGAALARLGRLEEARSAVEEAAQALAARGPWARRAEGSALADLATILLQLADEKKGPEQKARAALERLDTPRERGHGAPAGAHAHALAALAEILLAERRSADALETARAALALIPQPEGGTPLDSVEARVRLVHVEALAATGDHAAARSALAEARLRLLARAAALGDSNLRRSFLDGVPENARTLDLSRLAGIPARAPTPPTGTRRTPPPPSPENEREASLLEARKALERGNPDAAIAHVERGMNYAAPSEVRAELRALMARAHGMRNAWVSAGRWAEQGLREAAPGSRGWYAALAARITAAAQLGERSEIVAAADALPRLVAAPGAGPAVAVALASLGAALTPLGETARVQDCFDRLERAGAPLAARDPIVRAWMSRAGAERARVLEEDPWTALRLDESSRASFVDAGDSAEAAFSLALIGVDRWQLGAHERAEEALRAALDASGPRGHLAAFAGIHLGWTLADAGRLSEASAHLVALARAEPCRTNPTLRAAAFAALADVFRRRHDPDAADREAEAALSTPGLTPLARTATLATQAAIRLARGRPNEALDLARRARTERESLRVFGLRDAFVRLVHIEALLATGDQAGARTPLSRAYARLLVHASKIGDPALRASFLERIPEHARTLALARQWLGDVADHAFR